MWPFGRFAAMPDAAPAAPPRLDQLIAQLLDGVILIDPSGVILSVNEAALRMHGMRSADELGATAEDYAARFSFRSQEGRPLKRRETPVFKLLAGDSFPDLVVQVAPAGEEETRWVHQVRDVAMDENGGEPDCLALVINDVSDRFDAEQRFEAMFRANPAPALILRNKDRRIARVNDGFAALTGTAAEKLCGKTLFGSGLLSGLAKPDACRAIEAGEVVPQTEAELATADGSRRLVLLAGQPIDVTDEDALLLTFADLEPRRQAQDALAASARHLQSIFALAPVAMLVTRDADHRVVRLNEAFAQLTGREGEEIEGEPIDALGLWATAGHPAALAAAVKEKGGFRNLDGQIETAEGGKVDCLLSAASISVEGVACVLWLLQDITERRRSELELAEAIDAVMKDASWFSRSVLDKLANLRRPGGQGTAAELSPREREILDLICDDLDDGAIAERLALSRNTVRNHVARLYAKIGVNRRSGAVVWGWERGMGSHRR